MQNLLLIIILRNICFCRIGHSEAFEILYVSISYNNVKLRATINQKLQSINIFYTRM